MGESKDDKVPAGRAATETRAAGRGRRRGPTLGRQLILTAAHAQFGEFGYQATTIRGIARAAGVDAKLVYYYFGTKGELFTAAIAATFRARGFPDILAEHARAGEESPGTRYVAAILTTLEHADIGPAFIGLVRNLGTHEESRQIFLRFVTEELISILAPQLVAERPETRVALAGSQLLGVVLARYVLKVPPLAELEIDVVARSIGPSIDRYISGEVYWGDDEPVRSPQ